MDLPRRGRERWLRGNALRAKWLKGNGLRPRGWYGAQIVWRRGLLIWSVPWMYYGPCLLKVHKGGGFNVAALVEAGAVGAIAAYGGRADNSGFAAVGVLKTLHK